MGIRCKNREAAPRVAPCSIEHYVAKKDPFRVAPTNQLPTSWPFNIKHEPGNPRVDRGELFYGTLEHRVRDTLGRFGINVTSIAVPYLHPRGFPDAAQHILAILTPDTDTSHWQEAVDEIYEIVSAAAAQDGTRMSVMLENHHMSYSDISIVVAAPRADVMLAFISIEAAVEAAVQQSCPDAWTSIAYHYRKHKCTGHGNGNGNGPFPTVIVFVMSGSEARWSEVEAQIRGAIEAVPFPVDVELGLEILPGFSSPATAPSTEHVPTTKHHAKIQFGIPSVPNVGASIGPQLSDTNAGTMGIVVNFKPNGAEKSQKCFLTSYHAIAARDPLNRATHDAIGIGLLGRAVDRPIEVAYPAIYDSEFSKELFAKRAAENKNPEKVWHKALVGLIKNEGVVGEVIHASGARCLAPGEGYDAPGIGRISPAYFYHGREGFRVDWALVALDPSKAAAANYLPACSAFPPPCTEEPEFTTYRQNRSLGGAITGVASHAPPRSWVARVYTGRAATAGRVNFMRRTVRWADGWITKETEVIAFFGDFSGCADDGAMVFNEKKEWVGMLIGGDSECAGYITPAPYVIADIHIMTQGTVTLI
ncbi:hypothetical protein V494_00166 [Pseudogymnoascus sp. VKM F-4513 (FW-928)]|nr:hypothetical protein V494_00166 [Pseudogymnoascus sp. VKM F-4513 (FW-928)]